MSGFKSGEMTVRTNRGKFAGKQIGNIEKVKSKSVADEFFTGKNSGGDTDFVRKLPRRNRDMDTVDNSDGKIVSNQAGPNFLTDKIRLGGMEFYHANRVFEMAEGSFNPPPAVI